MKEKRKNKKASQKGALYIVATPIGNLEDITLRALRVLKEVDVVFAEDTRVGKKLLSHFDINTPVERYDEHSHDGQAPKVLEYLKEGKNVALITDAGTPGISDPGQRLISMVGVFNTPTTKVGGVSIVSVPGASAVTAALSVSGLKADSFSFLGFVPHKKGRKTFFQDLAAREETVVFYESPHRILKALQSLTDVLPARSAGGQNDRMIVVTRELTKVHEEVIRGSASEVLKYYRNNPGKVRGEFVVIVKGK